MLGQSLPETYRSASSRGQLERLSSSWLLPSWYLFGLRLVTAIYAFTVLFFQIGWLCARDRCTKAGYSFSYFTALSYWGLAFYFSVAASHTAVFAIRRRTWLHNGPGLLRWLHSIFYTSVTVFPFIVTAVYWAVLSEKTFATTYSTWSNISQHVLNSLLALLEILLPCSEPHPWINLPPLLTILACYLGLTYVSHADYGRYVYKFLDPKWHGRGIVVGACFGILAAAIIVFVLVRYLIYLRVWVVESKLGMRAKSTKPASSGEKLVRTDDRHDDEVAYQQNT